MKAWVICVFAALFFGTPLVATPVVPVIAVPGCLSPATPPVIKSLAERTNVLRAQAGLAQLPIDMRLMKSAQKYACDLASRREVSHIDRQGRTPLKRVRRDGFTACFSAENLAAGIMTPQAAVAAWDNSAAHSRNQLDRRAAAMGFGVAQDINGRLYWTALYARPCF